MKRVLVMCVGFFVLLLAVLGVTYYIVGRTIPPPPVELKNEVEQGRKLRGEAVSKFIAKQAVDPLLEADVVSDLLLKRMVKEVKEEGIVYVVIVDNKRKIRAHTDTTKILRNYSPKGLKPLGVDAVLAQATKSENGETILDVAVPMLVAGTKIGEVHTGILSPETVLPPHVPVLPTFMLMLAIGAGGTLLISIFGVFSVRKLTTPKEIKEALERLPELRKEADEISQRIAQKREEVFSLTKAIEEKKKDEEDISKRIAKKTTAAAELPKKATDLEAKIAELSKTASAREKELVAMTGKVEALRKEEQKLRGKMAASAPKEGDAVDEKIEVKRREELELTQRIVAKRREEIAVSQRIEARRKEELDLARRLQALKKRLESGAPGA